MAGSWCNSNNGMWTDPETGETKPCIKCNTVGGGAQAMKVKGGNCAVIAVIFLGVFFAAVAGLVEAVRQVV